MERRTFFKVIGALAASAAIPSTVTTLIEASQPVPAGMAPLGLIRELSAYDIYKNQILLRYDILSTDCSVQFSICFRVAARHASNESKLNKCRRRAKRMFEDKLLRRGMTWNDITPLPLPPGYKTAKWTA